MEIPGHCTKTIFPPYFDLTTIRGENIITNNTKLCNIKTMYYKLYFKTYYREKNNLLIYNKTRL
jgi:hypothetical protein